MDAVSFDARLAELCLVQPAMAEPTRHGADLADPFNAVAAAPAPAKQSVDELALFGGPVAFPEPLHVGRPNLGDRERFLARVADLWDRRYLSNDGPYVREFEQQVARRAGARYCVAISNGTTALELTARALQLTGEVIVPALTFVATAHAMSWQGLTPVFADVDERTCCLDPRSVERLITPRTSAIVGVHLWGRTCDVEALTWLARRHNLRLLFDAAHAFGCTHAGRPVGSLGDAEVFSFHASKFVHACEGGAIATNDERLAERIRLLRNFGFAGQDRVVGLGTNAKMHEISAAMGLTSLEHMGEFIAVNRRNYWLYRDRLRGLAGVCVRDYDDADRHNFQYVVIDWDESRTGLSRDQVVAILQAEGVLARRYFHPGVHRMEPYASRASAPMSLPVTERIVERSITLPTGTAVSAAEVQAVVRLLRFVCEHADSIRARLNRHDS